MAGTLTREQASLEAATAGRYSILGVLGRGGMGVVYLARDLSLDRPVAIKLLPKDCDVPGLRERFVREARIAAGLSHPNIVPIHAVEERDDIVFFVMAYVEGETLRGRVERSGPLSVPEAARIIQEVAWALSHAHGRGTVHRDIKPDNIILERGTGRALVTDFGIARDTTSGETTAGPVLLGTPSFMSPEQLSGRAVDARSDLYSLGVTAFYALTGVLPFEGPTLEAVVARVATEPAPPLAALRPDLPRGLAESVDRCLAKDPAARFPSAEAVAEALTAVRANAPETPFVLAALRRQVDRFAVDASGYAMLAVVLLLAPRTGGIFTPFEDVARTGVVFVLLGLATLSVLDVLSAARTALRAGYGEEDLGRLYVSQRSELRAARVSSPARTLVIVGSTALLTVAYWWLELVIWVNQRLPNRVAQAIDVFCWILPVVLGRQIAMQVLQHASPIQRWWNRLWVGPLGRALFGVARVGLEGHAQLAPSIAQPTQVVLRRAADVVFRALPTSHRRALAEVPDVLARLEADADALRLRQEQLDSALAAVGGIGSQWERKALATVPSGGAGGPDADLLSHRLAGVAELERARSDVGGRLATVMLALENIRIDLVRLRVGVGTREQITEDVVAARRIGAEVDALLAAREEVQKLLTRSAPDLHGL